MSFAAKALAWREWFCVLPPCKGLGLLDSFRFGLWLASRSVGGAIS